MSTTNAGKNLMTPQEYFSELQSPKTPRSSFDRGCDILTTHNAGVLVPLLWDEVLPSDTWNVSQTLFSRIATLIKPLMDNLYMDVHWFFVPNRIIWSHWVNFMGEQVDPASPISYTIPQCVVTNGVGGGTLILPQEMGDYFALPTGVNNITFSDLPRRAYLKIFDDYYRDENLEAERLPVSARGDATVVYGAVGTYSDDLQIRNKRKDYFTSALPWPQKGTAPTMALGTTAPVLGLYGTTGNTIAVSGVTPVGGASVPAPTSLQSAGNMYASSKSPVGTAAATAFNATNSNVFTDLSAATGFTLNAFREFVTIQQYLEMDARGGTRYVEHLYNRFGVQPEDARLQRAEYLGGQTFNLAVTPVAQTSESTAGNPKGDLSGMGTFSASGHQFVKSFTEDGIIMCIASVRQEQRYQFGLQKKWSRTSRYDFFDPIFANLGEQPILAKELFCSGNSTLDNGVFGYQEAWAEYRYNPSLVTGKFRSNDPQSLDSWHLAQDFASAPPLAPSFIQENPPMDRVIAVTDEPDFLLNGRFHLNVARPMPTRSIPGLTRL